MMADNSTKSLPDRQVIFVGGTSYSGSTMLDMMLANGDGGFSCGEIAAAFSPYRKRHFAYADHSASEGDVPWKSIIEAGKDNLFANIFDSDPSITRIIDSSKDPLWVNDQLSSLGKQGIEAKNIIIWKKPSEFLASRVKRNRKPGWQRAWTNYHKLYFKLIKDWYSISYRDLATDENALTRVCGRLDVPFFAGKQEYWRGTFRTLFGNDSAKVHLQDLSAIEEITADKQSKLPTGPSIPENASKNHRLIYYEEPPNSDSGVDNHELNRQIMHILMDRDANSVATIDQPKAAIAANLQCSDSRIQMKRIKRHLIARSLSLLDNVPLFRSINKGTGPD